MEQNNNILSAEGPLLDRINTYQREISEVDISLTERFILPNESSVYGYEFTLSKLKSWTDDLTSVLTDETAKKRINENFNHVSSITNKGIFITKTLQTIEGTKKLKNINTEVYNEFTKYLAITISILKYYTNKHFSSIKSNQRLIK